MALPLLYRLALMLWLAAVPGAMANDEAEAEKRRALRQFYRDVRALLDESDIATGSSRTLVARAVTTPCRMTVVLTPDAIEGGTELRVSLDLKLLDLAAIVPGVHVATYQGVDYRTDAVFIEHKKSAGITIQAFDYTQRANGFSKRRSKWEAPHLALVPRRPLGLLHDQALTAEANCINVRRLYIALVALGEACRT